MSPETLSNPFSSGGGGNNFETKVQAAFLVSMLVGGGMPAMIGYVAYKLKLQGRYAGYNSDDFIVFARNNQTKNESRLLAQVKHQISFTAGDETFCEVIEAAFQDFNRAEFDKERDKIAIICGPIPATDIENTRTILEWARHCENEIEFLHKIDSPQFSSDAKRKKLGAFRSQINKANKSPVSDEQLWQFLKTYHILSYDLDVDSGIHQASISAILTQYTSDPSSLFNTICEHVRNANQYAGTITLGNLPETIAQPFEGRGRAGSVNLATLEKHTSYIFEAIKTDINGEVVERDVYLSQLEEQVRENKFVLVTGARGTGKSGLVKAFIEKQRDIPCFYFRTEDFEHSHLDKVLHSIGGISALEYHFNLLPSKIIILESLEKLLELQNAEAFGDLITFLKRTTGWTVIATARDYAIPQLMINYFSELDFLCQQLTIGDFTKEEIDYLCHKIPELNEIRANPHLNELLSNPFMASFLFKILKSPYQFSSTSTVDDFKQAVWGHIIAKSDERQFGLPLKRREAFVQIAVSRAKAMAYWVDVGGLDQEALLNLQRDGLIALSPKQDKAALSHDVLEDWALETFIEDAYSRNPELVNFFEAIGSEQAICRAFRIWLLSKMALPQFDQGLLNQILAADIAAYWKDEAIAAILQSKDLSGLFCQISGILLADNCQLLKRFCFVLRIACQHPVSIAEALGVSGNRETTERLKFYDLIPDEQPWLDMIEYLNNHFDSIISAMQGDVLALLEEWNKVYTKYAKTGHAYKMPGLLAIKLLEKNAESYARNNKFLAPMQALAYSASGMQEEINAFLEKHIYISKDRRERAKFADTLRQVFLENPSTCQVVCKFASEITQKLAWHELLLDPNQSDNSYSSLDIDHHFGLQKHFPEYYLTPSGAKGFFMSFFCEHPWKALDFCIEFINCAAEKYSHSNLDKREGDRFMGMDLSLYEDKLYFADGTTKPIICSERLWSAFRGTSVCPYILQSLLMALENWLIAVMESEIEDNIIEKIFELIISRSNSCAMLAVLASVGLGFPQKCAKYVLPILSVKRFYKFDIVRLVQESTTKTLDLFGRHNDLEGRMYAEERRLSGERPWRNKDLRKLAVNAYLQMGLEEPYFIQMFNAEYAESSDPDLGLLINQIDIQNWQGEIKGDKVLYTAPEVTDSGIKELLASAEKKHVHFQRFADLMFWAKDHVCASEHLLEDEQKSPRITWQEALVRARELEQNLENGGDALHRPYLIKAAAILLCNYGESLLAEDASWCVEIIAETIAGTCESLHLDYGQKIDLPDQYGIGACARALCPVYLREIDSESREQIKELLLLAITHRSKLVRVEVARGVSGLWKEQPEMAKRCVWWAIEYARFMKSEDKLIYYQLNSADTNEAAAKTILESRNELRNQLFEGEVRKGLLELDFEQMAAGHTLEICLMLPTSPIGGQHIKFAKDFIEQLCLSEPHKYSQGPKLENYLSFETHVPFAEWLGALYFKHTDLVLEKLGEDIKKACEYAPSFTKYLFLQILMHCEQANDFGGYKIIFDYLMQKLISLAQKDRADKRHDLDGDIRGLLRMFINANSPWIKNLEERKIVQDVKEITIRFSRDAACHREVFLGISTLAYHFPELFLDDALEIMASQIKQNPNVMDANAALYCEQFIHSYLMNTFGPLPAAKHINLNLLLDALVERSSAKAYFLREHLVRSRKIEN